MRHMIRRQPKSQPRWTKVKANQITFLGGQAFAGSSALEDFLAGKPAKGSLPFGILPDRKIQRDWY